MKQRESESEKGREREGAGEGTQNNVEMDHFSQRDKTVETSRWEGGISQKENVERF